MKKCLHCGDIVGDSVSICPKCGALVDTYVDHNDYMDVYHRNHGKRIFNKRLILWFLLGFILPYIGFLVSWIFYDGERDRAKAILLGAIISSVLSLALPYILIFFFSENEGNEDLPNKGQEIRNLIDLYRSL